MLGFFLYIHKKINKNNMANFRFKKAQIGIFSTKDASAAIEGFGKGCRLMGFTRGDFSMIDLIHAILQKTGSAHVVCTTWSAGIKDAHNVKWMLDSNFIRTFQLITDHSYFSRKNQYLLPIQELFGEENIRTSEIHAKFTLIHNEDFKVCVRTSMNLNANRTCESFELDEDEDVFDFYMRFVEHTFGDMPKGFVPENWKVSASLDRFFNNQPPAQAAQPANKWWAES